MLAGYGLPTVSVKGNRSSELHTKPNVDLLKTYKVHVRTIPALSTTTALCMHAGYWSRPYFLAPHNINPLLTNDVPMHHSLLIRQWEFVWGS